jgi:hypothetical protein
MYFDMSPVDQNMSYFPDEALYATLEYGSNGDTSGDPTYSIGDDQGEENWGFNVWDANTSNGFDTGNVTVVFAGSSDGTESLIVGSASSTSYVGDSFSSISTVQIQVGVQIPAEVDVTSLSAAFYRGGQLIENLSLAQGPMVNTINTPSSPQAEQVLTIIPANQNYTKVVITENVRMVAPAGSSPGPTDLFSNVFINSNG